MSSTDESLPSDLRTCLDELLHSAGLAALDRESPARDWPAIRAELASRNLGLVRVADPDRFSWPGYWLAVASQSGRSAAGLMYGTPSAAVWPSEFTGEITDGFVLTAFDLALDREDPYASRTGMASGTVVGLYTAPMTRAAMRQRDEVRAIAGVGLDGDRYAMGQGTFSGGVGFHVTLMDAGSLTLTEPALPADQTRRNIITEGLDLNALVGRRFRVGDALMIGRRLCEPCRHLEDLARRRLIRPLVHRAGLRADVLKGGIIQLGSSIVADPPSNESLA